MDSGIYTVARGFTNFIARISLDGRTSDAAGFSGDERRG
jgi:hypothetical protein